ncbi:MAG: SDR family NAD(P)-dependent oxidoreductase, partial [Candidatus Eisenbacteria bacterium]|nr:SDR family NAD(P)-dependent oxidoreductase [Candidatus Eisenbacteria bacterium]
VLESFKDAGLPAELRPIAELDGALPAGAGVGALIFLMPETDQPFFAAAPDDFAAQLEGGAAELYHTLQWLERARPGGLSGLRCAVLRAASGGEDSGGAWDAPAAFLKSLSLECAGLQARFLTLPREWTAERWAAVTRDELEAEEGPLGVIYDQRGGRHARRARTARPVGSTPVNLGSEDVVLVSGGAKGITCELALGLARAYSVKLGLLGSSPPPANDDDGELARNLRRFAEAGVPHCYVRADVADLDAVRRAAAEIEDRLGRVTAILHGAGISRLGYFRDKPPDEFLHCVRVKAAGFYNLLQAAPPQQLKAVHVVSSVLGWTGMRQQVDYTYANAWLDGAIRDLAERYPHIHSLSVGYSIWSETGLGQKIGALDALTRVGVTAIPVAQGVAAYLELCAGADRGANYVVTGRLTEDLESRLFGAPETSGRRFLETIVRKVPGVELAADAEVSQAKDPYLAEHVLDGTPVFPGVMAIEAMVAAAQSCTDRDDLPILRNVQFQRALVVPRDSQVVVRLLALVEESVGAEVRVRVSLRSDGDRFERDHVSAECLFRDAAPSPPAVACPSLDGGSQLDPEQFVPSPLFQGRLFRRIVAIHRLEPERESVTEIQVPAGERYYSSGIDPKLSTPSPAVRDSGFQSGAICVPSGYLPAAVREIRFHRPLPVGERVICWNRMTVKEEGKYTFDLSLFTQSGELLETLTEIVIQASQGNGGNRRAPAAAVPVARTAEDLQELAPGWAHALAMAGPEEWESVSANSGSDPVDPPGGRLGELRLPVRRVNLRNVRRAAAEFARSRRGLELRDDQVDVAHREDGKPVLCFKDAHLEEAMRGVDVSVSDTDEMSAALVGGGRLGVDIEPIRVRDAEMWRGLLGDDGYDLALAVAEATGESFDTAGTRVWTILETAMKSGFGARPLPALDGTRGGSWVSFAARRDGEAILFLSATLALERDTAPAWAMGVAMPAAERDGDMPSRSSASMEDTGAMKKPAKIQDAPGTGGWEQPEDPALTTATMVQAEASPEPAGGLAVASLPEDDADAAAAATDRLEEVITRMGVELSAFGRAAERDPNGAG